MGKSADDIRLVSKGGVLEPSKGAADAKLENDAVVAFVYKTRNYNFLCCAPGLSDGFF